MTSKPAELPGRRGGQYLLDLILKAVPLAMGIAVTVTAVLGEVDMNSGFPCWASAWHALDFAS